MLTSGRLAALGMSAALLCAANQPGPAPQTLDELKTAIARILRETKTPGAGIAIVSRDQVRLIDGVGLADVAGKRPATADTLFRIGSVSKAFASLSILQLQEQARLRLSDPVRQYAPEIAFQNAWESTDPVRIVNLLEHTTGWDDLHFPEYANSDPKPLTLFEGLAYHPDSRVSRWRPGTRMAYCNSGPAVAAYVVEKVSGQRFEDYVQQHLFGPIHMDTASYLYTAAVQQHLTTLYQPDGVHKAVYRHITVRPAGAINASPRDMANYVRFYLNRGAVDGAAVVTRQSIERMEHPESTLAAHDGLTAGYGLSNYTTIDDRGFVWHGHDGGIDGGLTEMAYLPDAGIGYAYMINSTNGAAFGRIHKLVTTFLTRGLASPAMPPLAAAPPHLALEYTGWAEPANPRNQMTYFIERIMGLVRISVEGQHLLLAPVQGQPRTFSPVSERLWIEKKQPVPTLALVSDTRDGRFVAAGGPMYKLIPAWEAYGELGCVVLVVLLMASSVLYALFWIPALLLGRLRPLPGSRLHLSVRALPLIAILMLAVMIGTFMWAGDDAIDRLGRITPWSISVFAASLLLALMSVAALVQAWRSRQWPIRRGVRIHSLAVAAACAILTLYLARWGVIGLRTWG
ncbi:MAG TPA: serine hydrolase domain-containing protein [Bryobacteraceae bacterium]|nr:serine hydrolase domain-containing protein [Bryobacteraceae bacterium]